MNPISAISRTLSNVVSALCPIPLCRSRLQDKGHVSGQGRMFSTETLANAVQRLSNRTYTASTQFIYSMTRNQNHCKETSFFFLISPRLVLSLKVNALRNKQTFSTLLSSIIFLYLTSKVSLLAASLIQITRDWLQLMR